MGIKRPTYGAGVRITEQSENKSSETISHFPSFLTDETQQKVMPQLFPYKEHLHISDHTYAKGKEGRLNVDMLDEGIFTYFK